MDSLREEKECSFFDANEHIGTMSALYSNYTEIPHSNSDLQYDLWIRSPESIKERRDKFFDRVGVSLDRISLDITVDEPSMNEEFKETNDDIHRRIGSEEEFSSSRSSMSCWSNDDFDLSDESSLRDIPCVSSPSFREREIKKPNKPDGTMKRVRHRWLSKLRLITRFSDRQVEDYNTLRANRCDSGSGTKVRRIKVTQSRKRKKEFSALYKGQVIQAHQGSISTMKFSPDGQYLASSGEDCVVLVWQVVEDQWCNAIDIPEIDPSCIYLTMNDLSELKPLYVKAGNIRSPRKTSDSACVIFPSKVFRLLEEPLHEFHGHGGEILDLSWSKNNFLLSSSVDTTVRMWQIGFDRCLKVFPHSNYVTCVQFNPVDENYFISGSIDGKVRIWSISGCQVVDWTDVRDIVTAVCYRPDGKGGIVGSMTGSCRYYNMLDNHLQLGDPICLNGKKNSPCRRITGLQFLPRDPSKVMVTCADSQVRILQGLNVIGKYKGIFSLDASVACVSQTLNLKHNLSVRHSYSSPNLSRLSLTQDKHSISHLKAIRSCEHFSANASIAIPWCGNTENMEFEVLHKNLPDNLPFSLPSYFSSSHEYFSESFPKGSATWPEETLPPCNPLSMPSSMHKSQYKFLKTSCQSTFSSHIWGLVIVTGGSDGRIRSFLNYGLPVPV